MSFRRGRRPPFSASTCLADASRRERPFVFKHSRKLSRRGHPYPSFFDPRRLLFGSGGFASRARRACRSASRLAFLSKSFLEKILIFFQFLELSPQRPVCWFLRQGGL